MAAFFGNRPSYVTASWANQRIYPRVEPTFEQPQARPTELTNRAGAGTGVRRSSSTSASFPPITRSRSSAAPESAPAETRGAPAGSARPSQPPPLYFPGANRQNSRSQSDDTAFTLPPNHIPSINSASTRLAIVPWLHHPIPLINPESSMRAKVRKWTRLPDIWQCLKQEPEELYDGWPVEFGGKPFSVRPSHGRLSEDEEAGRLSRFSSRRSGTSRADSGIAMCRGSTLDPQQHPLEPLYRKRIANLNSVIKEGLMLSRGWLALTELMWIVWFLALIVALAQGRGIQTGFLKGVEIGLVCVIILSALAINGVRMRRWALAEELRKRTRDWSPLPITSSTNTQLMRNYLDGDADPREVERPKDSPVLRWRLREVEGGYWIAYRPIIRCELITPATVSNPHMRIHTLELEAEEGAPGAVGDEEGQGALGDLPPGYEDDATMPATDVFHSTHIE
ncbi:uncharacterized protein JCM15063_002354 [Sporobolomyces koalae]|uniref:uncharacterized protein n=1 Tax=Sporobolomyces koalae TaxID=500713 RepID=UPI003175E03A